jgi:alpha-N-arabinofuranosidase
MSRNFMAVLPVAQCFNSFIRHADAVKMANFTMFTGLLANERDKGTYKAPVFYTFKLFSNNCRGNSVDTYVECDTFNTEKYKGIPYLDVTSVYSKETNTVFINVVNRHKEKAISADILSTSGAFAGKAEAQLINAESLKDPFSYEKRDQYVPVVEEVKVIDQCITYSFPAHSFTQIKIKVKK